jgi:hypothetical protein
MGLGGLWLYRALEVGFVDDPPILGILNRLPPSMEAPR